MIFFFFFLIILRPPRSTRTDTLFPYTTLFRSAEEKRRVLVPQGSWNMSESVPLRIMAFGIAKDRRGYTKSIARVSSSEIILGGVALPTNRKLRSEEHTSELQSLMRISYAVFCLKKQNNSKKNKTYNSHTLHN